jgi:hypothetical protein
MENGEKTISKACDGEGEFEDYGVGLNGLQNVYKATTAGGKSYMWWDKRILYT